MASLPTVPSTPQERLEILLRRGYFPAELPPPFTSEGFASAAASFEVSWAGADIRKYWTTPESYSIPRYGHARRKLSLVNPINQLHIASLIAKNWPAIQQRLARSHISEFKPEFSNLSSGRAITGVDFDGVSRQRSKILASYGRYVKTDVTRFYPSIYTHSIAWAILGKSYVKANHHTQQFKSSFANLLDKAIGAGQEGQTIGIPIGPDTSRIISELVAVEVEEIARNRIPDFDSRSVRYVDDIIIGLGETETAAAVLAGLSLALYEYQLEINAEKTATFGLGCPHAPEWIHFVRTFDLSASESRQRDDLDSFFEQSVYLSDQNQRDSALLYAVKRAATFRISASNVDHLVRWMLYCARRSAPCLAFVAEHLAAISSTVALPNSEIHDYILQQIPIKASSGHTDELAWVLFWAREIDLVIPASTMGHVMSLRSSVIALLTFDLWHRGLIQGALDFSEWQNFASVDGLKSEMWLLAYEATKKGWWPRAQSADFITSHKFFTDVWAANVEFYDQTRKARARVRPSVFSLDYDPGDEEIFSEYPYY